MFFESDFGSPLTVILPTARLAVDSSAVKIESNDPFSYTPANCAIPEQRSVDGDLRTISHVQYHFFHHQHVGPPLKMLKCSFGINYVGLYTSYTDFVQYPKCTVANAKCTHTTTSPSLACNKKYQRCMLAPGSYVMYAAPLTDPTMTPSHPIQKENAAVVALF